MGLGGVAQDMQLRVWGLEARERTGFVETETPEALIFEVLKRDWEFGVIEHAQESEVMKHALEFEVTQRPLGEANLGSIAPVVARGWVLSVAQQLPLEVDSDL